jgi:hypothetical protein
VARILVKRITCVFLFGNPEENEALQNVGIDGKIILKRI